MIHLEHVELLHWDMQAHQVLPLARGVTVLTGENGSGKTSVLDAIKVALGGELSGDRSTRNYLLKQAAPIAMVRLLVNNQPEAGSRRRPFDPLGEHSQDFVTLAVVFRATQERDYETEYYLLDGDVRPLDAGRRYRPLPTRQDYRDRLKKVGIGRQYLKLLSLPQGQIASFCRRDGAALFHDLYDIIGGLDAQETWKERVRELQEASRKVAATQRDLKDAREKLGILEDRVRRHEEFLEKSARLETLRRARPWLQLEAARAEVQRLSEEHEQQLRSQQAQRLRLEEAELQEQELSVQLREVTAQLQAHKEQLSDLQKQRDAAVARHARADARLGELERLRKEGDVPPQNLEELRQQDEACGTALAAGAATAQDRAATRQTLQAQLELVRKGITPWPPEVELFRAELHRAGILHHLLAEVVEVREDAWRPAIEAFFGRHRLAVLVQKPDTWAEAALLARHLSYPYGVLAPDIKGSSPADQSGLATLIEVRDPRYRSLIARLVRHVETGEPPDPLAPIRQGERLAQDGFGLSRVEARRMSEPRFFLGRGAREQQRQQLETELVKLAIEEQLWQSEQQNIRRERELFRQQIVRQEARLRWEAARDEFSVIQLTVQSEMGVVQALDADLKVLQVEGESYRATRERLGKQIGAVEERKNVSTSALDQTTKRIAALLPGLSEAEAELGRRLAQPVGTRDAEIDRILEEKLPLKALDSYIVTLDQELGRFTADERDILLPVNLDRQKNEVNAVQKRLEELASGLDATRRAAEEARDQYHRTTERVFRSYFARLKEAAQSLDFQLEGRLEERDDDQFSCVVRVRVGEKAPVHHDSEDLSGGQKAALSILMGMIAVSLETDSAGFFLIDEPFSASDVHKINELGNFLGRTGAQYLLSMPTTSDLQQCGDWLSAVWLCTRSRGVMEVGGRVPLAPRIKLSLRAPDGP
jgi:chromosome segregation ATPase